MMQTEPTPLNLPAATKQPEEPASAETEASPAPPAERSQTEPPQAGRAGLGLPVSLQIFSWFLLNLLIVVLVAAALFTSQGGPILNVLINGKSGERLDAIAADVAERINSLPREKWGSVLESYSRRYKIAFALTRREGDLQVGKVPPLPEAVITKIKELPIPRRPPPPRPSPDSENSPPRPALQESPRPGPPPERSATDPSPMADDIPKGSLRFIVREQGLYWIGVRVPPSPEMARSRGPTILVLVAPSLLSGGLLWDATPIWVVAAVLLGSALFWLPLVRSITVPLRRMRDAAKLMATGKFETRVKLQRADEIGSLADSLNHLGSRLEDFVSGQKRFLGDIAHELGSPLARMEFAMSILEQKAGPDLHPLLQDVREEGAQMRELLGEILQFTKAGLQSEVHFESVDLSVLLEKVLQQENIPRGQISPLIPEGLAVYGDPHFLRRALANVLRNAVHHAGHAGAIRVEARNREDRVLLSITDQGPGVPQHLIHRLSDPFFRTESARTRETGGVGLGLAIVKRCVEACGGSLSIGNGSPQGLVVELSLLTESGWKKARPGSLKGR